MNNIKDNHPQTFEHVMDCHNCLEPVVRNVLKEANASQKAVMDTPQEDTNEDMDRNNALHDIYSPQEGQSDVSNEQFNPDNPKHKKFINDGLDRIVMEEHERTKLLSRSEEIVEELTEAICSEFGHSGHGDGCSNCLTVFDEIDKALARQDHLTEQRVKKEVVEIIDGHKIVDENGEEEQHLDSCCNQTFDEVLNDLTKDINSNNKDV